MKFKKYKSNEPTIKAVVITEDNVMECAKACRGHAHISYAPDYSYIPTPDVLVKLEFVDKSKIKYFGKIGDYFVNENDDFRIISKDLFEERYSEIKIFDVEDFYPFEVLKKELDKDAQSTPRVGNSL